MTARGTSLGCSDRCRVRVGESGGYCFIPAVSLLHTLIPLTPVPIDPLTPSLTLTPHHHSFIYSPPHSLPSPSAGIGVGINQVLVVIIGGLRSPFAIPTILVLMVDFAVETGTMLEGDSLPASLRLLMVSE